MSGLGARPSFGNALLALLLLAALALDAAAQAVPAQAAPAQAAPAQEPQEAQTAQARYESARERIERAQLLLEGRRFERNQAAGLLSQAIEELAELSAGTDASAAEAREWRNYARYLLGDDPALAADLEREYSAHGSAYAAHLRGRLASEGEPAVALLWFERAARAAPQRLDYQLTYAESLAANAQREAALLTWDAAREQALLGERVVEDGAALLSALARILPGRSGAASRLARIEALLNSSAAGSQQALWQWHHAFALEELGRLAESEAAFSAATEGRSAEYERAHGRLLGRLGRRVEAAEHALRAARAGDAAALDELLGLAGSAGRARRWEEALLLLEQGLQVEPRHYGLSEARALTLSLAGVSLDGYRELAERWPERGELLNDAGLAAWSWGQPQEALAYFERALRHSELSDARENCASWLLEFAPEQSERAEQLLREVLRGEPGRDRALALLARARARGPGAVLLR
ncbi:MAG: hypothetical protein ACT4PU_02185 [Planctomycetota bacterium]